jgi:hypothetical protein
MADLVYFAHAQTPLLHTIRLVDDNSNGAAVFLLMHRPRNHTAELDFFNAIRSHFRWNARVRFMEIEEAVQCLSAEDIDARRPDIELHAFSNADQLPQWTDSVFPKS